MKLLFLSVILPHALRCMAAHCEGNVVDISFNNYVTAVPIDGSKVLSGTEIPLEPISSVSIDSDKVNCGLSCDIVEDNGRIHHLTNILAFHTPVFIEFCSCTWS